MSAAALLVAGCGASPSSCLAPRSAPAVLSGHDRREPEIAGDGGGGVVAVWESVTGRGIEAASRAGTTWSGAVALSARGARDPAVAMSPLGVAVAVWQLPTSDGNDAIQTSTQRAGGGWSPPQTISPAGTRSRRPQVAVDAAGDAVAIWVRDTGGQNAVVEISERPAGGTWSTPRQLSDPALRARRPRVALALDGAGAAVWEERANGVDGIAGATRSAGGDWSAAANLSQATPDTQEPDVAIGPRGDAVAIWVSDQRGSASTFAAQTRDGARWSAPVALGEGSEPPREVPRPERAESGADVVVLPDGRAVAAWSLFDGHSNRVWTALRDANGSWGRPRALSGLGHVSGGAQVAAVAGGGVVVAWEEVDGGLLRVRAARVAGDGGPARCADLATGRAEYAGPRVTGGAAPTAVFVGLNRGRVEAAPIP